MNLLLSLLRGSFSCATGLVAVLFVALGVLQGQTAPNLATSKLPGSAPIRIKGEITGPATAQVRGTVPPPVRNAIDNGRMDSGAPMPGVSMVFRRSAAQQRDLNTLITAQHNPASPQYHKWLTPDEFGARFGLAQQDIDTALRWLRKQGFTVERVSRSRDRILFSGSVAQVERSFQTELHYFQVNGVNHFSPSTELNVPAALSGLVSNIGNLDDFRPQPMFVKRVKQDAVSGASPAFTSGTDRTHYLSPGDAQLIYDLIPNYQQAMVGQGQAIAILGESSINLADIQSFQSAAQVSPNLPTLALVPLSGNQTMPLTGDESESDIDLEWSSTMAPGASIFFVYTGENASYNIFNSLEYAVDTRIAPIISLSYGGCEPALAPALVQTIDSITEQAVAQGQTLIAASGDEGASGCYGVQSLTDDQQAQLAVSYPASNPNWLAVGGSEFNESGGNYWTPSPDGSDVISSATSYIPEKVWNDVMSTGEIGAGGGGISTLYAQPAWQSSFLNISGDGQFREVPDISLASSYFHDPLLACSEDSGPGGFWLQGQYSSCTNGFRDQYSGNLTAGGGTSFAAPMFAGMLAIINQDHGSTGEGIVASTLYPLAANSTTYASAFHDIVSGDNKCDMPSFILPLCQEGAIGYSAGTGYDMASGLGSVDAFNLMNAWPSAGLQPSYVNTLAFLPSGPSATVVPQNTPITLVAFTHFQSGDGRSMTGTASFLVDGQTVAAPYKSDSNDYEASLTFNGDGVHVVVAQYSGDDYYSGANSTMLLNTLPSTSTLITASSARLVVGVSDTFAIAISPSATSTNYASGYVTVKVDGQTVGDPIAVSNSAATFTYTFTKSGPHTVEADYSGDSNFSPSSETIDVYAAAEAVATTTSIVPSITAPTAGINDPLTVTVTAASGSAQPTGNVSVTVDGTAVGVTPVLVNGSAIVNYAFATAGDHAVTASFVPQGGFTASQASITITVAEAVPTLVNTATSLTAASTSTTIGTQDNFIVVVTPTTSLPLPNSTLGIMVDGTLTPTTATLVNGTANFSLSFATSGSHVVQANFAGDSTFAPSSGQATVNVLTTGFTLTADNLAIQQGSSGISTVTITPSNGYTGTVAFKVTPSGTAPSGLCFSLPNATIAGGKSVQTALSVSTGSSCPATASVTDHGIERPGARGNSAWPAGLSTLACLVFLGCVRRRSRWLRAAVPAILLAGLGMLAIGCGDSSSSTSIALTPKGTYTLTITGSDTGTASITNSTTVTVKIQ